MSNEIPKRVMVNIETLSEKVSEYVAEMETQRTNDWCKCEWLIHPDDSEIDIYNCARCHHPRALHTEIVGMEGCSKTISIANGLGVEDYDECLCVAWVDPPKRRMRRGEPNPECPVHTKEGFLIGLFEWMFKQGEFDGQLG
jgi:hypothetical protein